MEWPRLYATRKLDTDTHTLSLPRPLLFICPSFIYCPFFPLLSLDPTCPFVLTIHVCISFYPFYSFVLSYPSLLYCYPLQINHACWSQGHSNSADYKSGYPKKKRVAACFFLSSFFLIMFWKRLASVLWALHAIVLAQKGRQKVKGNIGLTLLYCFCLADDYKVTSLPGVDMASIPFDQYAG